MARSIDEIQQAIKTDIRTHPALDKFLFPEDGGSQVGVFNLIIYVVSLSMYTFEVLQDGFSSEIQSASLKVPAGNPQWVRQQILNFQLGDQIILGDDFVPYYEVVDESKRIVTQCSITEEFSSEIKVNVAKGVAGSLSPLDASELTALEDYYFGTPTTQGIGFAGVRADFLSLDADLLQITGDVYFLGQAVEADVKTAAIQAIDDYFTNLGNNSFNGTIVMNDVVFAVQAVAGVDRFEIQEVLAREATVPHPPVVVVPVNGTYQTIAGYAIAENTLGFELEDTLTMIKA